MEDPLALAYEKRLIVLMETDEYNGFHQVMLNAEQFKKVSDACFKASRPDPTLKPGYEMGTITLSEEVYPSEPFDGLNSINE